MADAAVRLLSLVNQIDFCTKRVELIFEEGEAGTMGYLDRLGFFDHLSGNVPVYPARPVVSGAEIYGGTNTGLVEIASINPASRDDTLPSRLIGALIRSCSTRTDAKELEGAAWTIFARANRQYFLSQRYPSRRVRRSSALFQRQEPESRCLGQWPWHHGHATSHTED